MAASFAGVHGRRAPRRIRRIRGSGSSSRQIAHSSSTRPVPSHSGNAELKRPPGDGARSVRT